MEAYHAAIVRDQLYALTQASPEITAYNTKLVDIIQAISDLRDAVDGTSDMDQGVLAANGMTSLVPTDENGLVYSRSISEVLAIVYLGGSPTQPGGFYPYAPLYVYCAPGWKPTFRQHRRLILVPFALAICCLP